MIGKLALACCAALASTLCQASSDRYCDQPVAVSAQQQDKMLRFSQLVKAKLDALDTSIALVSRSGLDLSRFNTRYSHSGYALKNSPNTAWSVRQLYYACDESKPRIFDQGMAGFVLGTDSPKLGYISVITMPQTSANLITNAVSSNEQSLALLHPLYSANAYAFADKYQNCNQWVAEMFAAAMAQINVNDNPRRQAQTWLKQQGFEPSMMKVGNPLLMLAAAVMSMLHNDDHPQEDLAHLQYRVAMPAAIESFIRSQIPQASRIEFCHNDKHMVVRRGWTPIGEGCEAGLDDEVIALVQ